MKQENVMLKMLSIAFLGLFLTTAIVGCRAEAEIDDNVDAGFQKTHASA
jgi:hypothetical protein